MEKLIKIGGIILLIIILVFLLIGCNTYVKTDSSIISDEVVKDEHGYVNGLHYEKINGEMTVNGILKKYTNVRILDEWEGLPVKRIFMDTFKDSNVEEVIIGNNVEVIGTAAFKGCKSLKSIVIPENVKVIGVKAFYYCSNLESVIIYNQAIEIQKGAFDKCDKITEPLYITE